MIFAYKVVKCQSRIMIYIVVKGVDKKLCCGLFILSELKNEDVPIQFKLGQKGV